MTPTTSTSLKMGVPNALFVICRISNGYISLTGYPFHFIFRSMVGFLGAADRKSLFPGRSNPRWQPAAILEYSNGHIFATGDPIHFMFGSRVGFSGSANRIYFRFYSNPRWRPWHDMTEDIVDKSRAMSLVACRDVACSQITLVLVGLATQVNVWLIQRSIRFSSTLERRRTLTEISSTKVKVLNC